MTPKPPSIYAINREDSGEFWRKWVSLELLIFGGHDDSLDNPPISQMKGKEMPLTELAGVKGTFANYKSVGACWPWHYCLLFFASEPSLEPED